LHGNNPEVTSAKLADLTATWLAGYQGRDKILGAAPGAAQRDDERRRHLALVQVRARLS
jgi:hypothetical protein